MYVSTSGFVLGHRWQPLAGMLTPQASRLRYNVVLRHEWTLLGIAVFNNVASYDGYMPPVE